MSTTSRTAANRFASVMNAMTVPVTIRSHVFCRSMRPGSPAISTASIVSSTAGTTHAGWTRYRPGRITCRPATTMIARATGHQCSPRWAAGASPIAGRLVGFGSVAILHDEPDPGAVNPAGQPRHARRPARGHRPGPRSAASLHRAVSGVHLPVALGSSPLGDAPPVPTGHDGSIGGARGRLAASRLTGLAMDVSEERLAARSRAASRAEREVGRMAVRKIAHPSIDERKAKGLEARDKAALSSHTKWRPAADRPDPVALLEKQDATREPDLVPVRHGRMMVSPFTFYRGAAAIMAADLAATPAAGLEAQLCGDAHLSNFGAFASPERRLLFDLNDFDETLPGPFEYDVKRMAASFTIAAQNNGFSRADARRAATTSVRAYREAMASFADMPTMDVWYARLSEQDLMDSMRAFTAQVATGPKAKAKKGAKELKKAEKRGLKTASKARTRDSLQALSKLGETVDGRQRIVSQPPIIVPLRELGATYGMSPEEVEHAIHEQFRAYRATLQHDRRRLLERFEIVDVARKVVGVGSVGTRAFIVLLQGRDEGDPLFLQVKEATSSVLEDQLPKSAYRQPGERVVHGQRLMQAASDIFLGWTKGVQANRYFYWRQLRDMKGSAVVESMAPETLVFYAQTCGWTLSRAHARSGDAVAIAAYLGKSDAFDRAISDFAERYAEQNDRDYQEFAKAIESGGLEVVGGV